MGSGSINLSSNQANANGRIDWQSYANQAGNYSSVSAQVYVVLTGWGIQGTGAGQWKENGILANTFSPYVNIAWGGAGTVQVFNKNNIIVNHNDSGDAGITLGCDMQFSFAGISNIGGSGWCTMDHIPRYASAYLSERGKTINSISINWSTDANVDTVQYSLNGGGWNNAPDAIKGDYRNGYFTISNLSNNTTYNVVIRVKRTDSQLWSSSSSLSITTYQYATLTEAPSITIGQNATVKYNNPSGASVEVGIFTIDSTTSIVPYISASGGSYTFVFTSQQNSNIYALIPNSTKINLRYYIKTTQNGKTYYNYLERTFSINTSESTPTFNGNITCIDNDPVTTNLTGDNTKFILNYSNAKVNINNIAVAKNSATIKNYNITDGTTTNTIQPSTTVPFGSIIYDVSRNLIEVYAIDSRGLSVKNSVTLNTINYTEPIIDSSTNLKRVNGVGTSLTFIFSGSFWKKNFGSVTNNIKFFKYKKILAESNNWDGAEWIDIPNTKYTIDENGNIKNVENAILTDFEIGTEYKVKIRIEDELNYSEMILNISSGDPIIAFNKQRKIVGIGELPDKTLPQGSINLKGDIYAGGQINTKLNNVKREIMSFKGNVTDFNNTLKTGFYFVGTNSKNGPYTEELYGYLEVWVSDGTSWNKTDNWIWQKFTDTSNRVYKRYAVNNSSWFAWEREMNSIDSVYPVGSIYLSMVSTNPSTFFGGTWKQISYGRVLVGIDTNQTEFNTINKSGGSKSVTLNVSQIPPHAHTTNVAIDGGTGAGVRDRLMLNGYGDSRWWSGTTQNLNTGGGEAHTNLQPYLVCYIWQRIS